MKKPLSKGNNDIIDGLTYPYLERLERHIPRSVTPNSITVAGFLLMVVGVATLIVVKHPIALLVFAVFSILSTTFDGLDGIHARRTGQTSKFGDFLDHFLDQLSGFLVLFGILVRFDLFTPLYVFICLSLTTINTVTFVFKSLSGYLYIGPMGPSTNVVLLALAFLLIFIFDDPVLFSFHPSNPSILHAVDVLGVRTITIGKSVLLLTLLFVPGSFVFFYRLARDFVAEAEREKA